MPDEVEEVAQAVLAVIGNLHGIDSLPPAGPDAPPRPLPDAAESLSVLAATSLLSGPAKLEVLSQLARARQQSSGVESLARSLVHPDVEDPTRNDVALELLARLEHSKPGREPLGRSPADLRDPHALVKQLNDDVQTLALEFEVPDCDTVVVEVGTTPALSIRTEAWSTRPIKDFVRIVDPREWPNCPVQHAFFRSMDPSPLDPAQGQLDPPDVGWKSSIDHRIAVDQGYLLVEDLKIPDMRRTRTLKQVHFTVGDLPPSIVCPLWGPATMVIAWGCMGHKP